MYKNLLATQWMGSMYVVYALLIFFAGMALGAICLAAFRKRKDPVEALMDPNQERRATEFSVGHQVLKFIMDVCDELGMQYSKSNIYQLMYFHYRHHHFNTMLPTDFMIANPKLADQIVGGRQPLFLAVQAMVQYGDISDVEMEGLSRTLQRRMTIFAPWDPLTPILFDTENASGH